MQTDELIHNLAVQWFHANGRDEVCLQAMFDIVRGAYQEAQAEAADR